MTTAQSPLSVTYQELSENFHEGDKQLLGQCVNCNKMIDFEEIAKEVRNSCLEELICQNCWDQE